MLSSNVLSAVLTLMGMPERGMADTMQTLGLAMFSASMKSSADAAARATLRRCAKEADPVTVLQLVLLRAAYTG